LYIFFFAGWTKIIIVCIDYSLFVYNFFLTKNDLWTNYEQFPYTV